MKPKLANFKRELISTIHKTRAAVLQAATQLSHEEQDTVFLGVWSVMI